MQLSSTPDPTSDTLAQLATAQPLFTLLLSANYQQRKFIPHWGRSEQPGSTYYLQKLSFDIFGIVDHKNDKNSITVLEKGSGQRTRTTPFCFFLDTSPVLSLIIHGSSVSRYFSTMLVAPIRTGTFLGMQFVEGRHMDHLRFCFLLAGHTKFGPDRLFSLVANEYNREDVFTPKDVHPICSKVSTASIRRMALPFCHGDLHWWTNTQNWLEYASYMIF